MMASFVNDLRASMAKRFPVVIPAALSFRRAKGHLPNIFRPKTFSEHCQARKVFDRSPKLPQYADKVLVKSFVSRELGQSWVIPTIWHGTELPPESKRDWKRPFVIKANNGSATNIFVREHDTVDWAEIDLVTRNWLRKPYGLGYGEWLYRAIEPQLLVEPFIGNGTDLPVDYKFWVFHGRCVMIQVDTGRERHHRRRFFDRNWSPLPFGLHYPIEHGEIERPSALDGMLSGAEKLGRGFGFVRVDLYEVEGAPVFGEMTFYPGSGIESFTLSSVDVLLGRMWAAADRRAVIDLEVELARICSLEVG
jgi:hypothetical protein